MGDSNSNGSGNSNSRLLQYSILVATVMVTVTVSVKATHLTTASAGARKHAESYFPRIRYVTDMLFRLVFTPLEQLAV